MLSKFLLSVVFATAFHLPASAQTVSSTTAGADNVIIEMNKAFKRVDKIKLTQMLPQARGHALEPWAAYWELKVRLGDASAQEVQEFIARYAR